VTDKKGKSKGIKKKKRISGGGVRVRRRDVYGASKCRRSVLEHGLRAIHRADAEALVRVDIDAGRRGRRDRADV